MKIKFTDKELQILTNYETINQNIRFKANTNILHTISTMRNIFATYDAGRIITNKELCIYDLKEFLNVLDRFNTDDITVKDNYLLIKDEDEEVKFYLSAKETVVAPTKDVVFPEPEFTFELKGSQIKKLLKMGDLMKTPDLRIYNDNGHYCIMVLDKKSETSNSFKLKTSFKTNNKFNIFIKTENLKMLIGDYKVDVSKESISRFTHLNHPLVYFIATEPDSRWENEETFTEKRQRKNKEAKKKSKESSKMLETKPRKSSK